MFLKDNLAKRHFDCCLLHQITWKILWNILWINGRQFWSFTLKSVLWAATFCSTNTQGRFDIHGMQTCNRVTLSWHGSDSKVNKADVEIRQTLGCLRSLTSNMITHFAKESSLLFQDMCVVCTWSNQDCVSVSYPMSTAQGWGTVKFRCQSLVGCLLKFADIGSDTYPILPMDRENRYGLPKRILPMILISWPFKLANIIACLTAVHLTV